MSTPLPDVTPSDPLPVPAQIFPSLIRTIVPMLVGWILAQLAVRGLNLDPTLVGQILTWVITAVYYGLIRFLETRFKPLFGWFLGLPKAPTYRAPAAPSPASPSGAVATVDTPGIPAGAPVDVVADVPPVGDDGPEPDPAALQTYLKQVASNEGID